MPLRPPKTVKKTNEDKQAQLCRAGTASQAIGILKKNMDVFVLTYGQFSLIDALLALLDQTGPAHVCVCTWTAAHADLTRSAEMLETAEILSFRMIVDRSFKTRQPKYHAHMVRLFGHDSIRAINTHAKFMLIQNGKFDLVIRTSMNLNRNPRLENIEISENKDFARFFEKIVHDTFREVKPEECKISPPELSSLKENTNIKTIIGNHIKRSTLNEPKHTHKS